MARRGSVVTGIPVADFAVAIAERAYFKAQSRGFVPGHELEDWFAAERELKALLADEPDEPEAPASKKKPAVRRSTAAPAKSASARTKKNGKAK